MAPNTLVPRNTGLGGRGLALVIAAFVFPLIAVAFVASRLYSRYLTRQMNTLQDSIIILSMVSSLFHSYLSRSSTRTIQLVPCYCDLPLLPRSGFSSHGQWKRQIWKGCLKMGFVSCKPYVLFFFLNKRGKRLPEGRGRS